MKRRLRCDECDAVMEIDFDLSGDGIRFYRRCMSKWQAHHEPPVEGTLDWFASPLSFGVPEVGTAYEHGADYGGHYRAEWPPRAA